MIVLTSLILSLAPLANTWAWQPLPLSKPKESTEYDRYNKSEHDLKSEYNEFPAQKQGEGGYEGSYFAPENEPYTEKYQQAPIAPPTPVEEPIPPYPGPDYVWVPGYWRWGEDRWVWVYGNWVKPPYPRAQWEPGYWYKREESWYWRGGRWK